MMLPDTTPDFDTVEATAAFVALALFGGQAVHAVLLPTPGVVVPPLLAGTLTTAGITQIATLDGA